MDKLPQDERFLILLHKKIMNKTGSTKRRAKKYYMDQYRKTGIIPKPLLLAAQGIAEGRKCSGRPRVLSEQIIERFIQMVQASSDLCDDRFIFISQKGRTIKNYHCWLQEEFNNKISLPALRRCAKEQNLAVYLKKPDFDDEQLSQHAFKDEVVFDLIQIDGCHFQYLKIRHPQDTWKKPLVIETFDTGARYMFALDAYFSESSRNGVDIFSQFLLSTPFPEKEIRLRPDRASGFLNFKRLINAINTQYSVPEGFYLKPDFARVRAAKDKVHLESSHRTLHNFEIRIIKAFEDRIVKVQPTYTFKNGKRRKIALTYLDISLEELRESGMIQAYRREHNNQIHHFSVDGETQCWIPSEKLEDYLSSVKTFSLSTEHVRGFEQYGYDKKRATVSKKGTLTFGKRTYVVVVGAEKFSRHQSTTVYVSHVNGKLLIFEHKEDGLLLGEAVCQEPFQKPPHTPAPQLQANEVELIAKFLEENSMVVDMAVLIERHRKGLSLAMAKAIYQSNKARYDRYLLKLRQPPHITGLALFNAFILDCTKHQRKNVYGDKLT
jgi:hypothetical protein